MLHLYVIYICFLKQRAMKCMVEKYIAPGYVINILKNNEK